MATLILASVLIILATYFYYFTTTTYKYWEKKGIPYIKPVFLFGNVADCVFRKKSVPQVFKSIYAQSNGKRYVGCYQFLKPTLYIRDPQLIEQITVKDFNYFSDHNLTASKSTDPLWAHNLLSLTVYETGWRETRAKITPSFSATRLKGLIPHMQECTRNFIESLNNQQGVIQLEAKDAFRKIGNDIIASVVFGITVNSIKDPKNKFFELGKRTADFSGIRALIFFGYTLFPTMMKYLRIRIYDNEVINFFRNLVKETLKTRKEKNIVRQDFIHLLSTTDDTNKEISKMTVDEITAHSVLFFFAGFESISSTSAFAAYQLAIRPDIQQNLYNEIKESIENGKKSFSYNDIVDMKYLEKFTSELLRVHPPNPALERKAVKPYNIEPKNPGEKALLVDKNSFIWIPVEAIHKDPNYFPNPDVFDPERFNSENKKNIKPCTYIPFGNGPRNCIASRFALLQIKMVIIELLKNFEFVSTEKTEIPLSYKPESFISIPKNGIWIGMKAR
ncbi:hypothetical protein FQR65_LT07523 [Abscondita terminalis]|nr:hypothetical protein FQR65_LT07523 [Abscondita terminalis]